MHNCPLANPTQSSRIRVIIIGNGVKAEPSQQQARNCRGESESGPGSNSDIIRITTTTDPTIHEVDCSVQPPPRLSRSHGACCSTARANSKDIQRCDGAVSERGPWLPSDAARFWARRSRPVPSPTPVHFRGEPREFSHSGDPFAQHTAPNCHGPASSTS